MIFVFAGESGEYLLMTVIIIRLVLRLCDGNLFLPSKV